MSLLLVALILCLPPVPAEASRAAHPLPGIPVPGVPTGGQRGASERQRPAPRHGAVPSRTVPVAALAGRASWYRTPGLTAAAGPQVRRRLGPGWRGAVVLVRGNGHAVRVTLTDWCQCYRGQPGERLLDLSATAFARLAPLRRGLVRVAIAWP